MIETKGPKCRPPAAWDHLEVGVSPAAWDHRFASNGTTPEHPPAPVPLRLESPPDRQAAEAGGDELQGGWSA